MTRKHLKKRKLDSDDDEEEVKTETVVDVSAKEIPAEDEDFDENQQIDDIDQMTAG